MRFSFSFIVAALLALAATACAQSAKVREAEAEAAEEFPCMKELPVTAAMVREAGSYKLSSVPGVGNAPPYIMGYLSPTRDAEDADIFGAVMFARSADGAWRAWLLKQGESTVSVYRSDTGALLIATMWTSEARAGRGP